MLLNKEEIFSQYIIKSYSRAGIIINDQTISHSIILTSTHLFDWPLKSIHDLKLEHWNAVIALSPAILIIGTGWQYYYPDHKLLIPLYEHRIGFEVMTTAAACRTITLLFAEKRSVVAALILD